MNHNLNPFDFVPLGNDAPNLKMVKEWREVDDLVSGWLDVKIRALTPVHIVGKQEVSDDGEKIRTSLFYKRNGKAYIPGSSIKGLMRSFLETACNGWASEFTPYYAKEYKKHHIGFAASREIDQDVQGQIDSKFLNNRLFAVQKRFYMPEVQTEAEAKNIEVDLASFLFGYITPKGFGVKGSIIIEDALIPIDSLSSKGNSFLDINADAFMGGGKPSASSWWYQKPFEIRLRKTKVERDGEIKIFDAIEFVGIGFRGRKYYFHQNPSRCIQWYNNQGNWPPDTRRPMYKYEIECLQPDCMSEPFRIYFDEIPKRHLMLLFFALSPGKRIRHKIGYGKQYGYGSIAFDVLSGQYRKYLENDYTEIKPEDEIAKVHSALWHKENMNKLGLTDLHRQSLEHLLRILWYEKDSNLVFTYPTFNRDAIKKGFLPVAEKKHLEKVLNKSEMDQLLKKRFIPVSEKNDRKIAQKLSEMNVRPALHFDFYKENTKDYKHILQRKLEFPER